MTSSTLDIGGRAPEPTLADLLAVQHPAETAGQYTVSRVPLAREGETVGEVVGRLAERDYDTVDTVYVVDANHVLAGAIRITDLLRASKQCAIGDLVDRSYPQVSVHDDQEHVAAEVLARGTTSAAVVDSRGRLLGAVPAIALLRILRNEHVEDLHVLAGIRREAAQNMSALESPPTRRARHRLPWLLVGLVGSMLAAFVMSGFEKVLESQIAVAFFVPAIVYLADAIGTQTEAIVVRGLSLNRLSLRHLLAGEVRTGLLIGLTLAVLSFPASVLMFGDVQLGVSVAAAIFVAGGVATTVGLLLPWFLQRIGGDPAYGSGPVATIVQDVLSLLIYFTIAGLLVR